MKAISAILVVLALTWGGPRLSAQGRGSGGKVTGDNLDFPLLKKYEEERRVLAQQEFEKRRRLELSRIRQEVQIAMQEGEPDARVSGLLRAHRDIQKMLRDQSEPRLIVVSKDIWQKVLAVPPPETFPSAAGLDMTLVNGGNGAFYATSHPLTAGDFRSVIEAAGDKPAPAALGDAVARLKATRAPDEVVITGLSWSAASALAEWVTELTGKSASLPSLPQARDMGSKLPQAIWTSTEWGRGSVQAKRDGQRFGVRMYCIWDPGTKLGGEKVVPELPFASYPVVGVCLVTDMKAGVEARMDRLSGNSETGVEGTDEN